MMNKLQLRGAEGIIGLYRIPLSIKPEDTAIPLFDTKLIHANAAVNFALA